jgi:sugar lactone lactonase YvrE
MVIPLALLTACGGGGGKSGSLPPVNNTPQTKKTGTATFSLKLPGKNTMSRVRRPYYQSQATLGVAIDWTSTDPTHPDYSAPISAVCPGAPSLPPGVTGCTIDANGDTDYSFQLQIPGGTYTAFTVTTFDTAPTLGDFTGNQLAQGQVGAPVVITAGVSNTIPSLTFYGIPATVSFVPAPSQSHVVQYGGTTTPSGSGPQFAIIGNAPQAFYVQAVDADGFLISSTDSGAPTIAVSDASSTKHFNVATTSNASQFTLTAIDATANATINATATPGGVGLSAITHSVIVAPVQELWTSQSAGPSPNGIVGYPLYPPAYTPGNAIDLSNPSLPGCDGSCNWQWAAMAPNGNIWVYETETAALWVFGQGSGSQGPIVPTAASPVTLGPSPAGFTIDSNGLLYLTDTSSGNITIYNTASPSNALVAFPDGTNYPSSVAIAPNAANVPTGLVGSIWVADSTNISAYTKYTSGTPSSIPVSNPPGSASAVAFDAAGHLWVYDPDDGLVDVYSIGGSASSATMSLVASTSVGSADGSDQLGVTAQGTAWMGGPSSLNGLFSYSLSGSTLTIAGPFSSGIADTFSVMIAP